MHGVYTYNLATEEYSMIRNLTRQDLIPRSEDMNSNQLERLRKDAREIGHYTSKLKKLGKEKLAYKMSKKREFLEARIYELEEEYL